MALITGLSRTEQLNKEAEYIKLIAEDINDDANKRIIGNIVEATGFDFRVDNPIPGLQSFMVWI